MHIWDCHRNREQLLAGLPEILWTKGFNPRPSVMQNMRSTTSFCVLPLRSTDCEKESSPDCGVSTGRKSNHPSPQQFSSITHPVQGSTRGPRALPSSQRGPQRISRTLALDHLAKSNRPCLGTPWQPQQNNAFSPPGCVSRCLPKAEEYWLCFRTKQLKSRARATQTHTHASL